MPCSSPGQRTPWSAGSTARPTGSGRPVRDAGSLEPRWVWPPGSRGGQARRDRGAGRDRGTRRDQGARRAWGAGRGLQASHDDHQVAGRVRAAANATEVHEIVRPGQPGRGQRDRCAPRLYPQASPPGPWSSPSATPSSSATANHQSILCGQGADALRRQQSGRCPAATRGWAETRDPVTIGRRASRSGRQAPGPRSVRPAERSTGVS
jgi:hypothetical protein